MSDFVTGHSQSVQDMPSDLHMSTECNPISQHQSEAKQLKLERLGKITFQLLYVDMILFPFQL